MKMSKRLIALLTVLVIMFNFSFWGTIQVFAHDAILDVDYDDCDANVTWDGIDEIWYDLVYKGDDDSIYEDGYYHLGDDITTIRYYFAESIPNGTYTWTTDLSESQAEELKNAFAESMEKWNNVYFYSYDDNGVLTKHKIINVEEGTEYNHNLSIYPYNNSNNADGPIASTLWLGNSLVQLESDPISHYHASQWRIVIYVNQFLDSDKNEILYEREGAHELGHILGLFDVDSYCNVIAADHHQELLMGYGAFIYDRAVDISYKDIAGVAITRGFHTDNDHKWINYGSQSDGTYKLVCSICNGIKSVTSLSGYTYETYGACDGLHYLFTGNMMAIASYGTKDYYKCKYCRYVAPFESIMEQNYTRTYHTDSLHKCSNTVTGLRYFYYENHTFVNNQCTGCGYSHTHSYSGLYLYHNNYYHSRSCSCGQLDLQAHSVMRDEIVDNKARCLGCRRMLDLTEDFAHSILSIITQVSVNGSYVLPSGIVVLVDEDAQAYMDGMLVFYHPDDLPTTQ